MRTNLHKSKFQPHLTLTENTRGRDFIVSDLHGHRAQLDSILEQIDFSYTRDRLISVGDLIDRGPDSPGCLDLLEEPWFWAVRGNHEQMLIETVNEQTDALWSRWLTNGGSWVLEQPEVQLKDWSNDLQFLPLTITFPCLGRSIGICHAEFTGYQWDQRFKAKDEAIIEWLWGRSRLKMNNSAPIEGVDWVFNGHTLVPDIKTLGNSVFIERGAYLNNPLTVLDLQQWLLGR